MFLPVDRVQAVWGALLRGSAGLLAPPTCLACRAPIPLRSETEAPLDGAAPGGALPAHLVCAACQAALEPIQAGCGFCGRSRGPFALPTPRCEACAGEPGGGVAGTVALLRYRRVARRLLHRLKYGGAEELAAPLGLALGRRVREAGVVLREDAWVVPVPLHPLRRLGRGFDQAAEIALGVGEALDRPCVLALSRRRWTRPLFRLAHPERAAVVESAFRVRGAAASRDGSAAGLKGRPVLLVDDIRTSGATLRAAARALRLAGSGRVLAAVVAR